MYRYFNRVSVVGSCNYIYSWKSKGLSDENIKAPNTSDYKLLMSNKVFFGAKTKVEFNGSYLKKDKVTYNHGKVVNIYIVYEISRDINISNYPTLKKIVYLVHLVWLKMLTNKNVLDMELDLIDMDFFTT